MPKRATASSSSSLETELQARLDAISAIARAVNLSLPIRDVLNLIAETTCRVMEYDFGAVVLADHAQGPFLIEGSYGLSPSYIDRINAGQPDHEAYFEQRPLVVPDVSVHPAFGGRWADVVKEQGYRSVLAVPIVSQNGRLGQLNCYTVAPRDFSASEVAVVETIANQAAVAIEAAKLHAREQATIARLETQHTLLERAEEIHNELTSVILNDEGLHAVADALARLMKCEVVIEDMRSEPLAAASLAGEVPKAPHRVLREDARVAQALALVTATRKATALPPCPDLGVSKSCLLAPVLIGGEIVAHLWVMDLPNPSGPLEVRAVEHGATVIALELLKRRRAQAVEWRLRGDLLADLLSSEYGEIAAPLARAAYLGHDLSLPHVLLVIRPDASPEGGQMSPARAMNADDVRRRLLSMIQAILGRFGLRALATSRGEFVVTLLPCSKSDGSPDPRDVAEAIRQEVAGDLSGSTVSVAVSTESYQLADLAGSFHETRGALEFSQRLGAYNRVVAVDQLGVYRLLLQKDQPYKLTEFSHRLLSPLSDYDDRHHFGLIETLRTYLAHECSVSKTADALNVHRHTLGYRLQRIEEITGLDLRRIDSLLQLRLALMVHDLLGAT